MSGVLGETAETLLVDLSLVPPPDDTEVRAWAADQSVFVSSVMAGMKEERAAAVRAVEAVGARPVWFEAFGGMDDDPEDAYLGNVAASDIYLGVLGRRYGRALKSGYSATHAEYSEAVRRGLRVSVWCSEQELDGHQQDFLDEVRVFQTTGTYATPDDLFAGIERRLRVMAAESIAPWVKVGGAIVRAASVHDDGDQITVVARIRDNTVAGNLESRRPNSNYGRNSVTRITWPGGTTPVRITRITSETTSSRVRVMTIVGRRLNESRSNLIEVSFEGRSPDDLTELAMRIALFDEPNPLRSMSFMAEANNVFPLLEGLGLSEDSFPQVAELLIAEELVGIRGADHITQFRLGPRRSRSRQLRLSWIPRRRYTDLDPVERTIEGRVPL